MKSGLNKELEDVLMKADYIGLRKFFEGKTEEECKSVSKTAIAIYKKALNGASNFRRCAFNAVMVTADEEQLDVVPFWYISDSDFDFELLLKHRQKLSQKFIERLVDERRIWPNVIKVLADRNLCTTPDSNEFIVSLMGSLPRYRADEKFSLESMTSGNTFLTHYVWRFFEVEGSGENSLAAHDKFSSPESTWQFFLVKASEDGLLSRERLLDASLQALAFDFAQFRSGWYSRFHEALNPTIEERISRTALYGQLMGSAIPPTVTFATNALTEINKVEPISPDTLLMCLEPALSAKAKSTVNAALALLDSSMERHHDSCTQLSVLATRAFLNGSPEVQTTALKIISKHNSIIDPDLQTELSIYDSTLSPSARKILEKLLGRSHGINGIDGCDKQDENPPSVSKNAPNNYKSVPASVVYAQVFKEPQNPINTNTKVEPFSTAEELIAGCAYALEQPAALGEHDRVIEGIVRLNSNLPQDFASRTASLRKRAMKFASAAPWSISRLQQTYARFVYAWLTNQQSMFDLELENTSNIDIIARRLEKLLQRISRKNFLPVLSASTHSRGFIDPDILLRRWSEWDEAGQTPDFEDQAFALLRLPLPFVDVKDEKRFQGEFWRAVRFAAGQSDENFDATSSILWSAAHAYREPPVVAKAFKLDGEPIFIEDHSYHDLRTYATYFPAVRAIFVASGIRRLGMAIDLGYEEFSNCAAFVEPLADPSFVFNRHAYCILSAAMLVANPGCSGLARDVLIQMIEMQQLDVEALGTEINSLLFAGNAKVKRLIDSLSEVARISPMHSNAARQLLERALQGGAITPKPLSPLLEFLNELLHAEDSRLKNPATLEYLNSIESGGKTKLLIRQLLK